MQRSRIKYLHFRQRQDPQQQGRARASSGPMQKGRREYRCRLCTLLFRSSWSFGITFLLKMFHEHTVSITEHSCACAGTSPGHGPGGPRGQGPAQQVRQSMHTGRQGGQEGEARPDCRGLLGMGWGRPGERCL